MPNVKFSTHKIERLIEFELPKYMVIYQISSVPILSAPNVKLCVVYLGLIAAFRNFYPLGITLLKRRRMQNIVLELLARQRCFKCFPHQPM